MKRLAAALTILFFLSAGLATAEITAIRSLPGGATTSVQFNDNNQFGGSNGLTYNKNTQTLRVTSVTVIGTLVSTNGFIVNGATVTSIIFRDGSIMTTKASGSGGGGSALRLMPNNVAVSTLNFPPGDFLFAFDSVAGGTLTVKNSSGPWSAAQQFSSATFKGPVSISSAPSTRQGPLLVISSGSTPVSTVFEVNSDSVMVRGGFHLLDTDPTSGPRVTFDFNPASLNYIGVPSVGLDLYQDQLTLRLLNGQAQLFGMTNNSPVNPDLAWGGRTNYGLYHIGDSSLVSSGDFFYGFSVNGKDYLRLGPNANGVTFGGISSTASVTISTIVSNAPILVVSSASTILQIDGSSSTFLTRVTISSLNVVGTIASTTGFVVNGATVNTLTFSDGSIMTTKASGSGVVFSTDTSLLSSTNTWSASQIFPSSITFSHAVFTNNNNAANFVSSFTNSVVLMEGADAVTFSSSSAYGLFEGGRPGNYASTASPSLRFMSHGDQNSDPTVWDDSATWFDWRIQTVSSSYDPHNAIFTLSDSYRSPILSADSFGHLMFMNPSGASGNYSTTLANMFSVAKTTFNILSSGLVGIGTVGPRSKLEVVGAIYASSITAEGVINSTTGFLGGYATFSSATIRGPVLVYSSGVFLDVIESTGGLIVAGSTITTDLYVVGQSSFGRQIVMGLAPVMTQNSIVFGTNALTAVSGGLVPVGTGVLDLSTQAKTSGVTANTYTNATITVNDRGIVTSASNGSAGGAGGAGVWVATTAYQFNHSITTFVFTGAFIDSGAFTGNITTITINGNPFWTYSSTADARMNAFTSTMTAIGISTQNIQAAWAGSASTTNSRIDAIVSTEAALGISTTNVQSNWSASASTTNSRIDAIVSTEAALGISTANVQSNWAGSASTTNLRIDNIISTMAAIGASTTTLRSDLTTFTNLLTTGDAIDVTVWKATAALSVPIIFQNAGSNLSTATVVNCGTGLSCSNVGSTITLTATAVGGGGSAGVWIGTTAYQFNHTYSTVVFVGAFVDSGAFTGAITTITINGNVFWAYSSTADARMNAFGSTITALGVSTANVQSAWAGYSSTADLVLGSLISTVTAISNSTSTLATSTATLQARIDALSLSTTVVFNEESPDVSNRTYFLHSESSGGPGSYYLILSSPSNQAEVTATKSVAATDNIVLISSHITLTGDPGATKIPAGIWSFASYLKASNIASITQLVVTVSTCGYDGSGLFEFLSSTSPNIATITTMRYDQTATQQNDIAMSTSDRIVVKYFARTTAAIALNVSLVYAGAVNTSHLNSPISGVYRFTQLYDAPQTLVGKGNKYVAVNNDQTALVFVSTPTDFAGGYSSTADARMSNFSAFEATSDAQQTSFQNFNATGDVKDVNFLGYESTADARMNAFTSTMTALGVSTSNVQSNWAGYASTADARMNAFTSTITALGVSTANVQAAWAGYASTADARMNAFTSTMTAIGISTQNIQSSYAGFTSTSDAQQTKFANFEATGSAIDVTIWKATSALSVPIIIQDESVDKGTATVINFVGSNVTVTNTQSSITVTISGGAAGGGGSVAVFDGTTNTSFSTISFVGFGANTVASGTSASSVTVICSTDPYVDEPISVRQLQGDTTQFAGDSAGLSVTSRTTPTNILFDQFAFTNDTRTYAYFVATLTSGTKDANSFNGWDGSTVAFSFSWYAGSGTAATWTQWCVDSVALHAGKVLDQAWGSSVCVNSGYLAANTVQQSTMTPAMTIGGTAFPGDPVSFRVYRNANDGHDNHDGFAYLIGNINLYYRRKHPNY